MTTRPIKVATDDDEQQAIAVLVLAFSADPVARWGQPDAHKYLSQFPEWVKLFAGKVFEHRSAYYIDGFSGVAFWFPPGVQPDEEALVSLFQRAVPERVQQDLFGLFEQMGKYHPDEPHWYLAMIGVEPNQQRRGFGSALMRHGLVTCDRDGKLAYLEASSPENVPFYERHGFEVLATIEVGSSPPIFPMLRKPR